MFNVPGFLLLLASDILCTRHLEDKQTPSFVYSHIGTCGRVLELLICIFLIRKTVTHILIIFVWKAINIKVIWYLYNCTIQKLKGRLKTASCLTIEWYFWRPGHWVQLMRKSEALAIWDHIWILELNQREWIQPRTPRRCAMVVQVAFLSQCLCFCVVFVMLRGEFG